MSVIPKSVEFPNLVDRCPKCDAFLWGYGLGATAIVTTPLHFRPDPECSTRDEIARWQIACYAAAAGNDVPRWSGMGSYWWGDRHAAWDDCDGVKVNPQR